MEKIDGDTRAGDVSDEVQQRDTYEEPQGDLEQVIAHAWSKIFKLERIGRDDNFFELGGNSLIAMELMELVSSSLDTPLPVVMLFQNPSPRQLAEFISAPE